MRNELKTLLEMITANLDPNTVHKPNEEILELSLPVLKALKKYFRNEVYGLEKMPLGKALLVGNHNAGITFLEPFFLGMEWYLHTGGTDIIHPLGHDVMVTLPIVGNLLKSLGVIRASHQTANQAFEENRKVLVFPGGNYEAFRPYTERNKVDFGGKLGYVKLALRNKVDIVPILSIGGHETFFVLKRGERIAEKIGVKKYLRSESFPIFIGAPWGIGIGPIFHLPLPSKSIVEVGTPIPLKKYFRRKIDNVGMLKEIDHLVQSQLQKMMDLRHAQRHWPIIG